MANPQKENGFTPIAHEILEHLSFPGINGSEYRVICFVLRKTYGFQKKKDKISISQFQKNTKMNRAQAVRTIKSLVHKRILAKDKNTYQFNKNWDEWLVCKRIPSMQKDTSASTQKDTKSSTQKDTHNRYIDNTIDNSNAGALHDEIVEILEEFKLVNPSYRKYFGNKTHRASASRLITEHGKAKVLSIIQYLPKSNGKKYAPTITNAYELEEKLGKLIAWSEKLKTKKSDVIL